MQHSDLDCKRPDTRFLSPADWTTFRAEILRRARIERNEAIRGAIACAGRGLWRLLKWTALRAAWISHIRKHRERIATAQLRSLSDPSLADMGLTRGEIEGRVRYHARPISQRSR